MNKKALQNVFMVFMVIAMLNVTIGCDLGNPTTTKADRNTSEVDLSSVGSADSECESYALVDSDSSERGAAIDRALATSFVQAEIAHYDSLGYSYAPMYSFVLQGYGTPEGYDDSILCQFVTLAMTFDEAPEQQAVYIQYVSCELGGILAVYMLAFDEWRPGFVWVTDGVWQKDISVRVIPGVGRHSSVNASSDRINDYLDCVRAGAAAGCSAAIVYCAISGPGFPACAAAGCAGAIVVAAIGCLFTVFT